MLKLEWQRSQLKLVWKIKHTIFNRLFYRALFIACALHVGAFFLFKIHSYFFSDIKMTFSIVDVDLSFTEPSRAILGINKEKEDLPFSFQSLYSIPTLPSFPLEAHLVLFENHEEAQKNGEDPFSQIEEDWIHLLNLKTAIKSDKVMQDFESESFVMGADHSQKVKVAPITNDCDSKDRINLSSSTAVFRLNP